MATRTVRLDEDDEATLARLQQQSGLSISELLKRGIASLEKEPEFQVEKPFDLYDRLDLGPGGYTAAPARDAKKAVRDVIAKKHKRSSR